MKQRYLFLLCCLVLAAIWQSCASGKQALQRGDYFVAVQQAVDRLRANPDKAKAQTVLRNGYPLAVNYYLEQINIQRNQARPFKWEGVMNTYGTLNRMAELIQRCPACMQVVGQPEQFYAEFDDARLKAVNERYTAGTTALERNTRLDSREAHGHFKVVQRLMPGFKDVVQLADRALYDATLKVEFKVLPVASRTFQLSNEFFESQMREFFDRARFNEYVAFYAPGQAQAEGLPHPDHIVTMAFEEFNVGQTLINRSESTVSRDSVKTGTVVVDGKTLDVFGTVNAKIIRFEKTVLSRGLLNLEVYDVNRRTVVKQRRIPGEFVWAAQWGTFRGDERALNDDELRLVNTEQAYPPGPQQLFIEFCRPIYSQATSYLTNYYRSF